MEHFARAELGLTFQYPKSLFGQQLTQGSSAHEPLYTLSLDGGAIGKITIEMSITQTDVHLDQHASPIFDQAANRIQIREGTPTRRNQPTLITLADGMPCQTSEIRAGNILYRIFLVGVGKIFYNIVVTHPVEDESIMSSWKLILSSMKFFPPENETVQIPSVVWSYYVGQEKPYSMLYPYDWVVSEHKRSEGQTSASWRSLDFFFTANDININVMVVEEKIPSEITFKDYYDMCKLQFQKSAIPLTSVTSLNTNLGGLPAKQFTYSPSQGTNIIRRFGLQEGSVIVISCESLNNQSLLIGPVLEKMMDSFVFTSDGHNDFQGKDRFHRFEHFDAKIALDFPNELRYNQDECLIRLFSGSPECHTAEFEIQWYPNVEQMLLDDPHSIQQQILNRYRDQMDGSRCSSEELLLSLHREQLSGLEFVVDGRFIDSRPCQRITRFVTRKNNIITWTLTIEKEQLAQINSKDFWGHSLLRSLEFL